MIESECSERPSFTDGRRGVLCPKFQRNKSKPLPLSPAQANALARLIQIQLDAYAEASASTPAPHPTAPLTGSDLDLLEPLVPLFQALSHPSTALVCKHRA